MQKVTLETNKLKRYRPNDMFTQSEVEELINACNNPRDKAIIAVLYDCGLRPHELIKMRISDVSITKECWEATVPEDTKTGARTILIHFALPYLRDWLNCHPLQNNSEAFICVRNRGLFRSENSKLHYEPHMTEMGLYMIFWALKKMLSHKIKKRFWHPYILRHTRITEWANILPEGQVKYLAGWKPDSPMPRVYVHMSGIEAKKTLMKHYGMIKQEDSQPPERVRKCPRCEYVNAITNKFCDKCSLALTMEAWQEIRENNQGVMNELKDLREEVEKLKNPTPPIP